MLDSQAWIERLVADPNVQDPGVLYIRRLRSLAAECTAADGGFERLVQEAVHPKTGP